MGLPLLDNIFLAPDLLAPGKKPFSDTGLTPKNKKLDFLYLLNRDTKDLSRRTTLVAQGTAPTFGLDQHRRHSVFNDTGAWKDTDTYNKGIDDYTVLAIGTYHSGGKYVNVQANTGAGNQEQLTMGSSGTSVRFAMRAVNGGTFHTVLSSTAFSGGDLVVMCGIRRGTDLRLFINGLDEGSTATGEGSSVQFSALILGGSIAVASWDYDLAGNIYLAAGEERAWTDYEALAFTRDPYNYLLETTGAAFIPAVPVVVGGRTMGSLAGLGGLAGMGGLAGIGGGLAG